MILISAGRSEPGGDAEPAASFSSDPAPCVGGDPCRQFTDPGASHLQAAVSWDLRADVAVQVASAQAGRGEHAPHRPAPENSEKPNFWSSWAVAMNLVAAPSTPLATRTSRICGCPDRRYRPGTRLSWRTCLLGEVGQPRYLLVGVGHDVPHAGSNKLPGELERALGAGVGHIVADSYEEIARLAHLTEEAGCASDPLVRPIAAVGVRRSWCG